MIFPDPPNDFPKTANRHRRIAMLFFPDTQIIDVTGPLSVFSTAADELASPGGGQTAYSLMLLASQLAPIATSCGVRIMPDRKFSDTVPEEIDTLIVPGGFGVRKAVSDKALIGWIRHAAGKVRRVASVCTGAYLLAEAGLLNGKRATTHWRYCDAFARAYPDIEVEPDAIHVKDGNIYSSAGVTAGMDLALALVEEDYDRTLALAVARDKVMFLKRPGGQSQFSTALSAQIGDDNAFDRLKRWIYEHLDDNLTVPALAEQVAMSPRNFARVFLQRTGVTPAKFVEAARLESCRLRLEDSAAPIEGIARDCGFGSAERLRKAFQRKFRTSPRDYRRRFRVSAGGSPHHQGDNG